MSWYASDMTSSQIHIGVFARDIDCIFYSSDIYTYIYIVENESVTHRWIRDFVASDQILTYDISDVHDPDSGIMTILTTSDLLQKLKTKQISYLHTTEIVTKEIEALSNTYGVTWIDTPSAQHEQFENKLWFDRFLTEHNISHPKSTVYHVGDTLPFKKNVLQRSDSWGSEGTFFVNSHEELDALVSKKTLSTGEEMLAREKREGITYGISLFICPGYVLVSPARTQVFQQSADGHDLFLGVQWIPPETFSETARKNIHDVFRKLGACLYESHYLGYANIDFIMDDDDVPYIIECNARYSAATTHIAWKPELMHGVVIHELFAKAIIEPQNYGEYIYRGMPDTKFDGTMLDLDIFTDSAYELKEMKSVGLYAYKQNVQFITSDIRSRAEKSIIYFSEYSEGSIITSYKTVGYAYTSFALCEARGRLNYTGLTVKHYYAY